MYITNDPKVLGIINEVTKVEDSFLSNMTVLMGEKQIDIDMK